MKSYALESNDHMEILLLLDRSRALFLSLDLNDVGVHYGIIDW